MMLPIELFELHPQLVLTLLISSATHPSGSCSHSPRMLPAWYSVLGKRAWLSTIVLTTSIRPTRLPLITRSSLHQSTVRSTVLLPSNLRLSPMRPSLMSGLEHDVRKQRP